MKIIERIKNNSYIDIATYILIFCFTAAGILVSLNRFWQYEVFYYDFGIFDQAIWSVSRFNPPVIDHLVVSGKWIFADHFSPSIFLLSSLYWLTSRSEMLLVIQALAVGFSALVLYNLSEKVLKSKLLSFGIIVSYVFFLGIQNAVISDFHELTVMTLPLMLTFWAFVYRKIWYFFLFFILTLGFKESTFLLGIGLGFVVIFLRKQWFKAGLIAIVLSILWGFVSIKVIIPMFAGGVYAYGPSLSPNIFENIFAFFDHPLKINTLFYSLLSFGFLPLLTPSFWPVLFQDYMIRFVGNECCSRWDLGLHYNAQSAVVLAASSVFALKRLQEIKKLNKILPILVVALIVNSLFLYRFVLNGPFALAYNPAFYSHTKEFKFLDELVKRVPKDVSVMTQNNIAPRFAHQTVYLLKLNYESYMPEYVVIDIRPGQNANNFFQSENADKVLSILQNDHKYESIYETENQFIFRKVNKQ
jgi:uncharacterized membrane protein